MKGFTDFYIGSGTVSKYKIAEVADGRRVTEHVAGDVPSVRFGKLTSE